MGGSNILGALTLTAMNAFNHASAQPPPAPPPAPTQTSLTADTTYDSGTMQSAYSRFITTAPDRQLDIQLKENQDAPGIRDDYKRASAGIDVVDDSEVSGLAGRPTHLYRSDPLDGTKVGLGAQIQLQVMYAVIDRKLATGQWGAKEQAELDRQLNASAAATGLDRSQLEQTVRLYEDICRDDNKTKSDTFGAGAPTPLKSEIGKYLTTLTLAGKLNAQDQAQLTRDMAQLRQGPDAISAEKEHSYVIEFRDRVTKEADQRRLDMATDVTDDANEARNGFGTYFGYEPEPPAPGAPEHSTVPKLTRQDDTAKFAAWFVMTPDLPAKPPPGTTELGEFLVSLHESEHNARRSDNVAPGSLSEASREQGREIDADRAILKYLDQAQQPAVKEYWLQMREVDSFAYGINNRDLNHDTATFLRLYEKTGHQLDLDKFGQEKLALLAKIKDKVDTPESNSRTNVGNLMGATQDLLKEDKAETDPAKKLSPMQLAEANSFLHDATAMGYKANPDYPHPKPGVPARPATAKPSSPSSVPAGA